MVVSKDKLKQRKVLDKEILYPLFLFIVIVDILSRLMLKAKESSLLEGLLVGRSTTKVPHLRFANDTIFFSKANMEDLQNLKLILKVFGSISRLHTLQKLLIDQSNDYLKFRVLDI